MREERLVASVGVAPNKFLAKLASDLSKPDGFLVLHEDDVEVFLHDLPVNRLWGVGRQTARQLEGIGLETTYTGKALAALFDLLRREQLYHRPVLFWNTVSSVDLAPLLARGPRREEMTPEIRRHLEA